MQIIDGMQPPSKNIFDAVSEWLNDDVSDLLALLDNGADVNETDEYGRTALFYAVQNGFRNCFDLLLERNANVHVADMWGCTAYHCARYVKDSYFAEKLLELGASERCRYVAQRELLAKGIEPCQYESRLIADAAADKTDLLPLLLEAGVDINARDAQGRTALIRAVMMDSTHARDMLLSAGADVNRKNVSDGSTPLLYAAMWGYEDSVRALLAVTDIQVDIPNNTKCTPLHHAARSGHLKCLELLIHAGADIHTVSIHGETPLQAAENNKKEACAALLRSVGAASQQ